MGAEGHMEKTWYKHNMKRMQRDDDGDNSFPHLQDLEDTKHCSLGAQNSAITSDNRSNKTEMQAAKRFIPL